MSIRVGASRPGEIQYRFHPGPSILHIKGTEEHTGTFRPPTPVAARPFELLALVGLDVAAGMQ